MESLCPGQLVTIPFVKTRLLKGASRSLAQRKGTHPSTPISKGLMY
ncbi:hypothetical protein PG5_16140 [Pseudomonas sp. G5(2012)]|nr:hypothetical protein PG5_16140 [Pseudomonas sp. G5(2012)]